MNSQMPPPLPTSPINNASCDSASSNASSESNIDNLVTLDKPFKITDQKISLNQKLVYYLTGEAKQQLRFDWSGTGCFWLYSPFGEVIDHWSQEVDKIISFPDSGKYLLLMTVKDRTAQFSLGIKLDELYQSEAVNLVECWLKGKQIILAPPWDQSLLEELTTSKLMSDTEGAVDWLEEYDHKFKYKESRIEEILGFSGRKPNPYLMLITYEDRILLNSDDEIDWSQSGQETSETVYFFTEKNGAWKISDYCDVDIITNRQKPMCRS